MNTQPEALRIAEGLEKYPVTYSPYAAAELRRLHEVNQELLEALERIALATEATVCNVAWVAGHARAAIAKATGEQT